MLVYLLKFTCLIILHVPKPHISKPGARMSDTRTIFIGMSQENSFHISSNKILLRQVLHHSFQQLRPESKMHTY